MDYRLAKLYEIVLKGNSSPSKPQSLSNLYEAVKQSSSNTASASTSNTQNNKKTTKPIVPPVTPTTSTNATHTGSDYDKVIAKVLFGDSSKVNEIPAPKGNYIVGQNSIVNPNDMDTYAKLFPVTPPKAGKTVEDTSIGTKGSGNGEIALYWLLNKTYDVTDNRSASKPDLAVTFNSKVYGIEVKAYDSKKIGLGRFGDQHKNRGILSIIFGLKALLNAFNPQEEKRAPSLDTFNKEELISSFELLKAFDDNAELKSLSHKYTPIANIYQQIDVVLTNLDLKTGSFTSTKGAAAMVLKLLKTKLLVKPGFETATESNKGNGYLASVSESGKISYHQITEAGIDNLSDDAILDNVNANGAALLITPDALFTTKPEALQ